MLEVIEQNEEVAEVIPSVNVVPQIEVEEMEIQERIDPNTDAPSEESILEDIENLNPDENDILEEIRGMDTFRCHELDMARETRGFTSDQF
jgi:hypothetical protein